MTHKRNRTWRGFAVPLLAAGVLGVIAVPTASLAVDSLNSNVVSLAARGSFASFTPASIDQKLAQFISERSSGKGRMMRFTPAGVTERSSRPVTVAIRVDEQTARAISVHSSIAAAKEQVASERDVQIAPTRYNLGLSRGYKSFAQNEKPLVKNLADVQIPDLAAFKPSTTDKDKPSRFAARIALDEKENAGVSKNTIEALGGQSVDLGGSYRVTRNLNVTAGVRYSQDRDRLSPLADTDQLDSQAVYIGTQFRF
ncbi:hypothetical protein [Altericroceibacterium endophyticum]|uniref:Uncharacterized protein n=1 Tax=Altericroceibacterium endophyticum TaxID=1808508 RepID=A0A6I4T4I7_9SPHN|nr:hypothetical protein [Altericroceibacterium endophyticum]MXO65807.1 hypothetical protein [Altericroceibacterium endophyticum]